MFGPRRSLAIAAWLASVWFANYARAEPALVIDLAELSIDSGLLYRLYGSVGIGTSGLPVAGALDVDGDGLADVALAAMRAPAAGRPSAGVVYLAFGDGTASGVVDTAEPSPGVLRVLGAGTGEAAGSAIWLDDVTGDGLADLLVGRQNASPSGRIGSGAVSIVVGGPGLRRLAESLEPLDLAAPPPDATVTTLVGAEPLDRLGIWLRSGDVSGDGLADLAIGADQTSSPDEPHRGAVWLVRGGPHLEEGGVVDLADFGATALRGHLLRVDPPTGSAHYHFGATCQIGDLDGDGRGELLAAAALNRAGAALLPEGAPPGSAHPTGGAPRGHLFIVWGDSLPDGLWPAGGSLDAARSAGATVVRGGAGNRVFGEELLAGLDYDDDGRADLFVGDLLADARGGATPASGTGHVVFDAARIKGLDFAIDDPPLDVATSLILGAARGDLAADTGAHGDFDGDELADLALSSPHASPLGRGDAGMVYVLHGQDEPWPERIDLDDAQLPAPSELRVSEFLGAHGQLGGDRGDTLAYSAAAGDFDGDGRTDLVTNEMVGNGLAPDAIDVGNLIVLAGAALARDDVEVLLAPYARGRATPALPLARRPPIELAVLGSQTVDPSAIPRHSLRFGPARAAPLIAGRHCRGQRCDLRDVDRDGRADLVLRFDLGKTGLTPGDGSACLVGQLEGRTFRSCRAVRVSPARLREGRGRR